MMAYIPTAEVLNEEGYEGASSQAVYGMPAKWSYWIETRVLSQMVRLAETIGVEPLRINL